MILLIIEGSLFCNIDILDLCFIFTILQWFLLSELLETVLIPYLCTPSSCVNKPFYLRQSH